MRPINRDPGRLRDRLLLLENQPTDDGDGAYEDNWVEKASIWGTIRPAQARSAVRAGVEEETVTHVIELRQPLEISRGMGLKSGNPERLFLVLSVTDPDETKRYWHCACRRED